ncbi:MAG: methyltransferase domain-containing protein [Spartobacteria bacterium]|nr:methyltransferase domain-containing protein [Spartobacteria bacterium]
MKDSAHQQTVANRFSAAAPMYEPLAQIQSRVIEALVPLLPDDPPRRILEAGCGTGLLTRALVRHYPESRIDAVDLSSHMLQQARNATTGNAVRWIQQSLAEYASDQPYDLIASSSALHWMDPFADGMKDIVAHLAEGGQLVCALMLEDTLKELHEARALVAPAKKPPGRLPAQATLEQVLQQCGISMTACRVTPFVERYTDGATFLRALHNMGLTGGKVSHGALPLNRSELEQLARHYDARYAHEEGGVYATYQVAFVRAGRTGR